jgi:glutamine amidotransferase
LKIGILDYGSGNLFNITLALRRQGLDTVIVSDIESNPQFDGLILPGVGNFSQAMKLVERYRDWIVDFVKTRFILGICLGMQLFFESSEEGPANGLGLVKGGVARLPHSVRIPHMGWNRLNIKKSHGILEGIKEGSWCYFMHSYYCRPDGTVISAQTEYGLPFSSVIESGTLIGTQFHPEKSGETGRVLLHNFVRMMKR